VSLHTRGVVAMAGIFGYELDPQKLSEEDKTVVREQIGQYKGWETLIRKGTHYRLNNPFSETNAAWMFVSEKKDRALLSVVMLEMHGNMPVSYVKLKGLDAESVYRNAENGRCYYGADLMEAGLPMPVEQKEYPAYQIELVREQ
ncbi:MAG: GH36 C-terminal domain-containing protein, partial [Lachnospiraceae bacterium]|nr:GH36 C-terminal domain-containing protein [Lachnospiraceae bacterium]